MSDAPLEANEPAEEWDCEQCSFHWHGGVPKCLNCENETLGEDKARLDWLEQGKTREIGWLGEDEGWVISDTDNMDSFIVGIGPTVREALDAARCDPPKEAA